ncbi:hypothetical protein COO60DRAFT_1537921, partial [Scenedesmus sp. NREL 46B-D3]
ALERHQIRTANPIFTSYSRCDVRHTGLLLASSQLRRCATSQRPLLLLLLLGPPVVLRCCSDSCRWKWLPCAVAEAARGEMAREGCALSPSRAGWQRSTRRRRSVRCRSCSYLRTAAGACGYCTWLWAFCSSCVMSCRTLLTPGASSTQCTDGV